MNSLEGKRALVTGGSRGLGLGIVEALVKRGARVTVVARNPESLAKVQQRLGVTTIAGDITDQTLAKSALRDVQPHVLVLNAGATPSIAPLHEQTWETFSAVWETDVKAGLYWIQEALRLPLPENSRVLLGSSGAAIGGSPLSGGYAGSKRMLWLLANYANGLASELGARIRFQVLVPQQMIGDTDLGLSCARGYARRKGVAVEKFLETFGKPMPPILYGEYIATVLTDPAYANGVAFGFKGETGIRSLDASAT
jgi:NAD(P)-dependent dehydrogenase (short-subunit alcohol dehydrogenase family)